MDKSKKTSTITTTVSIISANLISLGKSINVEITPTENESYGDSFLIKTLKPLSLQKHNRLTISSGFQISLPQPVDKTTSTSVVLSPYHIGWRVESNLELLSKSNIWAYGSSGNQADAELKIILFNLGNSIFNAKCGDVIATLQFLLVPNLQIKGFKVI